jgi:hypothetical protein
MKKILSLFILVTSSIAEIEVEGFIALDSQIYSDKKTKHSSNLTIQQQLKLSYEKNNFSSVFELYAQEDKSDYSNSKDNDRTFLRINELYTEYEGEDYKILLGKNIRFWGALEVQNIVDTFNIEDNRTDSLTTDKIGAYNISYSHYFEDSELSVIAKLYEQKNKMANPSYIYSILNEGQSYTKNLESEKSLYRPSLYLTYNGSSYGDEYSLDYAFIYETGYDSQRYFTVNNNQYTQHAYLVNKFMTYNTLVFDSTLYKLEALYANVTEDKNISDYIHVAIGIEHTLDALENGNEIGLITEYYYYDTLDNNQLTDLTLGETFQNDLFLGMRYSFNDADDSNAVGGIIFDTQYNEQSYYVEYETRIYDLAKVKLDYRYIEPSKTNNTVYSQLGRHQRIALNISYHF